MYAPRTRGAMLLEIQKKKAANGRLFLLDFPHPPHFSLPTSPMALSMK